MDKLSFRDDLEDEIEDVPVEEIEVEVEQAGAPRPRATSAPLPDSKPAASAAPPPAPPPQRSKEEEKAEPAKDEPVEHTFVPPPRSGKTRVIRHAASPSRRKKKTGGLESLIGRFGKKPKNPKELIARKTADDEEPGDEELDAESEKSPSRSGSFLGRKKNKPAGKRKSRAADDEEDFGDEAAVGRKKSWLSGLFGRKKRKSFDEDLDFDEDDDEENFLGGADGDDEDEENGGAKEKNLRQEAPGGKGRGGSEGYADDEWEDDDFNSALEDFGLPADEDAGGLDEDSDYDDEEDVDEAPGRRGRFGAKAKGKTKEKKGGFLSSLFGRKKKKSSRKAAAEDFSLDDELDGLTDDGFGDGFDEELDEEEARPKRGGKKGSFLSSLFSRKGGKKGKKDKKAKGRAAKDDWDDDFDEPVADDEDFAPKPKKKKGKKRKGGRSLGRFAALLVLLGVIGGGGYYAYNEFLAPAPPAPAAPAVPAAVLAAAAVQDTLVPLPAEFGELTVDEYVELVPQAEFLAKLNGVDLLLAAEPVSPGWEEYYLTVGSGGILGSEKTSPEQFAELRRNVLESLQRELSAGDAGITVIEPFDETPLSVSFGRMVHEGENRAEEYSCLLLYGTRPLMVSIVHSGGLDEEEWLDGKELLAGWRDDLLDAAQELDGEEWSDQAEAEDEDEEDE